MRAVRQIYGKHTGLLVMNAALITVVLPVTVVRVQRMVLATNVLVRVRIPDV